MKKLLLMALAAVTFIGCQKELNEETVQRIGGESQYKNVRENKILVSKVLAKAVAREPLLRTFLKTEALKKFDNDNDVLFHLVKNVVLEGTETVYHKVAKYASNKDDFDRAVNSLPLLNILVPDLPSFSPETWNEIEAIPIVAVEQGKDKTAKIQAYDSLGNLIEIAPNLIPAFPVLVVKSNERVVLRGTDLNISDTRKLSNTPSLKSGGTALYKQGGMEFSFAHDAYDGLASSVDAIIETSLFSDNPRPRPGPAPNPRPVNQRYMLASDAEPYINAYKSGAEWHRDYIYYGIDPSKGVSNGEFRTEYYETITGFRFNSGNEGYNQIGADPGEPQPTRNGRARGQRPIEWTEGQFEFHVTILMGSGREEKKVFTATPQDLFSIEYAAPEGYRPRGGSGVYDGISEVPKTLPLDIQIAEWDLERYGDTWTFVVTEQDLDQSEVVSYEKKHTSKHAANFEISPLGKKVKIGVKFGHESTTSKTETYTLTRNYSSDILGSGILPFHAPVFREYEIYEGQLPGSGNGGRPRPGASDEPPVEIVKYIPYEVSTGSVFLTVEPRSYQ